MLKDFKAFAVKGNLVDLAIGVIMGTAFGKVVSSFVADVVMPPIGLLLGGVDFSSLYVDLSGKGFPTLAEAVKAGAPVLKYGVFLNQVIDFTIIAFVSFLVVRALLKLKTTETSAAPTTKECKECLSPIPVLAKRCGHCAQPA